MLQALKKAISKQDDGSENGIFLLFYFYLLGEDFFLWAMKEKEDGERGGKKECGERE